MPLRDLIALVMLLALAVALAAGNLLITARRSAIPLPLQGTVTRVEVRPEKHPGKDDVYLVHLESGDVVELDAELAKQLSPGATVSKGAGDRTLMVNGEAVGLYCSRDFYGMMVTMPIAMALLLAAAIWSFSVSRRGA